MTKRGYPKYYGVQVADSQWMSQPAAARELGISNFHIVILLANGHLLAAKDSSGRPGVSATSVSKEKEWRGKSSFGLKLKRAFVDVIQWF